eukprot:CAMPEP_0183389330 /NCGR_PEP_ID=MMETSP0370-20130417/4865_1 /TAXON_ID=268820 /ORGANISM="Peridinium aciculiferum, Strain PAER-2" /LENGTH=46 /DNA_ID= /DNA_START= /DNA_END= /DNA_ORIENTATION=
MSDLARARAPARHRLLRLSDSIWMAPFIEFRDEGLRQESGRDIEMA